MFPTLPALRAPLALAGLALCAALPASAQNEPPATRVVVTASREPLAPERITADLVVIDEERIRAAGADTLEDLLRREAGLQLSRNGGPGQNASVFIRGAGSSSTVVLVDGVRIGSATLGQVLLESLSLSQIERIEVLRGPGSSLWGADAMGGVVQVFTRRADGGAPRFAAHVAAGSFGSRAADVAASATLGRFDLAASHGDERSDGVSALRPGDRFGLHNPDDDGFARRSLSLRAGFTPAAGHRVGASLLETRLNAQYDGAEYAPPTFAPDASPDFRNRLRNRVAAFDYRGRVGEAWTVSAQLARHDDRLVSGGNQRSRFDTERRQAGAQLAYRPHADHQFVGAVERVVERVRSDSFFPEPDAERDNDAVVLGYAGRLGRHLLQADWRHDQSSLWGGVGTGRLGWSTELAPGWRVRALAGNTFRAPSFNDLYFPGFGVATLRPERGRSVELGLAWQGPGAQASATLWHNRVRALIAYEPDRSFCPADPAYDFGCARNVARARLQGATLTYARRHGRWQWQAQVDFVDATDADSGQRLARRAAHQESLGASVDLGAWTLGASVLGVGARPDGGATLPAYQTLDLRAAWQLAPRWRLEARLLNATDRDIEPARDYQAPGRQAWLGLRYDSRGWGG